MINNKPKGYNNPNVEGKYHYRYNDPYNEAYIDCIDCFAPYSHKWTVKEKEKLSYSTYKNHYFCTFDHKFKYKTDDTINPIEKEKYVSKKFVCFQCQKIIKRPINQTWKYSNIQLNNIGPWSNKKELKKSINFKWPECTECKNKMICVNSIFKAPKKNNNKMWKYLEENWNEKYRLNFNEYMKYIH